MLSYFGMSASKNENMVPVQNKDGSIQLVDKNTVKHEQPLHPFKADEIDFQLFTLSNHNEPQHFRLSDHNDNHPNTPDHFILNDHNYHEVLAKSHFNPHKPTRFFIHGWRSKGLLTPKFVDRYFVKNKFDYNFIAVNWQKASDIAYYIEASRRVKPLGRLVAQFIVYLIFMGLSPLKLAMAGHSLGAHAMGIC